jgi:hypothetical protein
MSPLVLLVMTSCPVAAGPVQAPEPRSVFSHDSGEQPAADPNSGGRHSFFGRFRGWFHRQPHGNDNQANPATGDWGGKPPGYQPAPGGAPPSYFPSRTMSSPARIPTTAEPPLAAPAPPGK